MAVDQAVDVADRPLLALRPLAVEADREQRPERVGREQRAVAAAGRWWCRRPSRRTPSRSRG